MKLLLSFSILFLVCPLFGQANLDYLQLPVPQDTRGERFDLQKDSTSHQVLVGFLIPQEGAITGIAPLLADLNASQTLNQPHSGPWFGKVPRKFRRIEKPGYLPAGFRFLMVYQLIQTKIGQDFLLYPTQFQILWRPWKEGTWSAPIQEGSVYGIKAGDKDKTILSDVVCSDDQTPIGIWGYKDEKGLKQISFIAISFSKPTPMATISPTPTPLSLEQSLMGISLFGPQSTPKPKKKAIGPTTPTDPEPPTMPEAPPF